MLHQSSGAPIRPLAQGLPAPEAGSCIFRGDAEQVPWPMAVTLDEEGLPSVLYSVQVGSGGLPVGQGGGDIRYRWARFDGRGWQDGQLAFAGSRLYAGEDDYGGLAAFDPEDPRVVYFSTNADPVLGTPLISAADGRRHHELYVGATTDQGGTWRFAPLTRDSRLDHLRPTLVKAPDGRKILISLAGTYHSYTDYAQQVIALFFRGSLFQVLRAGLSPRPPV